MIDIGANGRHRVFVPQALGADEFLRVTWHDDRRLMVFSHWRDGECVAATPVQISDLADLTELMVAALARSANVGPGEASPWPAPTASLRSSIELPRPRSA